jgi:hypothetical protein
MLKISSDSLSAKLLQAFLAIGYVALFNELLAIQASVFGEGGSGLWHISSILVIIGLGLTALFFANFLLLRHAFQRLGLLTALAMFFYYYLYNPYGHNYILVYLSILRSPPHLINMCLIVFSPILLGKFIQSNIFPTKLKP